MSKQQDHLQYIAPESGRRSEMISPTQDINILDKSKKFTKEEIQKINAKLELALFQIQVEHDKKASNP